MALDLAPPLGRGAHSRPRPAPRGVQRPALPPWKSASSPVTFSRGASGLQEFSRLFRCRGCYSTVCDLPLDCPVKDVTVAQGDQALFSCAVNFQLPEEEVAYSWKFAEGGACPAAPSPPACGHPAAPHPGPVSLPRAAGGPREPGADPAGAGQAPRDLLLRDQARPAPPGAALLLPQRDAAAPAQRGRAPGLLPGSAELDGQGGGRGRALEAEPGRAAGPARGADAEQPVPARAGCGLPVSESDPAWVVSPRARTAPAFLSFLPQTPESRSRPSSLPRVQAPRPSSLGLGSPGPQTLLPWTLLPQPRESRSPDPPPSDPGVQPPDPPLSDPGVQVPRPSSLRPGSPGPQTLLPQTRESSPQTLLPRTLHLQHRESRSPDPPPSDSGVQVPRPSSLGPSSLSPGSPGPQTLLPRTQESSHQTLLSRTRESRSPDPPPSAPGVQAPRPSSLKPWSPAPRPSSLRPRNPGHFVLQIQESGPHPPLELGCLGLQDSHFWPPTP
ncbi:sperm acrosome membrane-associated protein 6 isoform X8 [Choloepus didactylus]|uniref:sperm acrosome membrane-associated protein 6 isoform X8 n=1 Tax=Choloepus didactylus TaxID=27675 RepID=UPI00189F885D|nr:sperm acrosome membrane-associated protein 6 isoform X8 [Choloepus didactylus]